MVIIITIQINNILLLITKLTIKTYLQINFAEEEKKIHSKHYLQVISFHKAPVHFD